MNYLKNVCRYFNSNCFTFFCVFFLSEKLFFSCDSCDLLWPNWSPATSLGSIISAVSKLIFVPNEQKDKQYYLLHVFYIFGKQYGYLQFVFSIEKCCANGDLSIYLSKLSNVAFSLGLVFVSVRSSLLLMLNKTSEE